MGNQNPFPCVVLALAASCAAPSVHGTERAVSVYAGRYTDNSLPEELALFKSLQFENATQLAAAYSEVFADPSPNYRWEWEVNAVHWSGDQSHQELAGLGLFRWQALPWDHWVDSSIALGNGLSWATEEPELEEAFHPDTGSTQLLYHIVVELEFARGRAPGVRTESQGRHWMDPWATFLRVHHRSGVFGVFDGVNGGSNVVALGLRYRW